MEMGIDRLSALPDDLLIRILSRLGVKQAATTSLLSKRWRFVWTDLPRLVFSDEWSGPIEEVNRLKAGVHGALSSRRGAALKLLYLSLDYHDHLCWDVYVWVELAARNKVQSLRLIPERITPHHDDDDVDDDEDHYSLHPSMYSNSSLKELRLHRWAMAPPTNKVEWRSMTRLSLELCILPQQVLDQIVSGCPALSSLELSWCRGFNRLEIGGRSFRSLEMAVYEEEGLLEISAPYMRYLSVVICPRRGSLRLTNVVSLEKVVLQLTVDDEDSAPSLEMMTNNAYQIFQNIRRATTLVLQGHSLKVVSMMATNGWQLPQLKVECMDIDPNADVLNIHGALLILESSPFLETLIIHGKESIKLDLSRRYYLNCELLRLKRVIFRVDVDGEYSCKSSFTLSMAHTLLERAPNLERIHICKSKWTSSPATTLLNDLVKQLETLFSHLKYSHKVSKCCD